MMRQPLSMLLLLASTASLHAHQQQASPLPTDTALCTVLAGITQPSPLADLFQQVLTTLRARPQHLPALEQLGRLYISQARLSHDEAHYQSSAHCADLILAQQPQHPGALLLKGHSQLAMHQFHDAEDTALLLLAQRQDMQAHALLGDALMEQGQLTAALPAYQAMLDAKPCMPSYSRIAHYRWLKGDLRGALDMAQLAATCGSYRDPEPLAWVTTRIALYQWQLGESASALASVERALQLLPQYAHALHLRGRIHLGQQHAAPAVADLRAAAQQLPLPEVQWALAEALELSSSSSAQPIHQQLQKTGAQADPRSYSLYLSTQRSQPELALTLAKEELRTRRDVFSWAALAWAQHHCGQHQAAHHSLLRALSEGTQEARLSLHAYLIAQQVGDAALARTHLQLAQQMRSQLLPSEQRLLQQATAPDAAE